MDPARLMAAANIARWRGWTRRHYSILEHMIVGTSVMEQLGYSRDAQAWFLLHDMHETEICGDVPTPDKARYCNDDFHDACDAFDLQLQTAYGLNVTDEIAAQVAKIDADCAIMEHARISTRMCDDMPRPDGSESQRLVTKFIRVHQPMMGTLLNEWRAHQSRLGLHRVVV